MSIEDALFVDLMGAIPLDAERADAVVDAGFRAVLIRDQQLQGDPAAFRRTLARAGVGRMLIALGQADTAALERVEAFGAMGVVVTAATDSLPSL